MEDWYRFLEKFVPTVMLASFAGFVSVVSSEKSLTARYIVAGISTSVLTGVILNACLLYYYKKESISGSDIFNVWVITIAVGGFFSREVMDIIKAKVINKIKSKVDEDV